jgi:mRNA interferase RelE/StbE
MEYTVVFRPKSIKDLDGIDRQTAARIAAKVALLGNDLQGDVKRLTSFTPEYRLRVGDWRVLFEVEGQTVTIHRVLHRSKAYE